MNKFKQVLTKDWEILCLKGQQMDKARDNEREGDKWHLNGQKTVFCVDLSQGRQPSQGVFTCLLPKHPRMSCRQGRRRIKEDPTTMKAGF